MYIPNSIAEHAFRNIKAHPHYKAVMQIVEKNCYDQFYMVGGMVYRNLAIAYHKDNVISQKLYAATVDYDFLVMGIPRKVWIPNGWKIKRRQNTSSSYGTRQAPRKNSYTLEFQTPYPHEEYCKIDLISIYDITPKRKPIVQDYFAAVPLDVQAIAYDTNKDRVFGHGIDAVVSKTVRLQNRNGLINPPPFAEDAEWYGREKAESMGFRFVTKGGYRKPPCTCESRDLLWHGCRCGGG